MQKTPANQPQQTAAKHQTAKPSDIGREPSAFDATAKRLPTISPTGGRLIRCRNMRMKAGQLQVCNQALLYVDYGKGEIKCPHSKCHAITAFEIVEPRNY